MTEGKVTGNSSMFMGFLIGAISGQRQNIYRATEIRTEDGETVVEHESGSRFLVTVRQIGGRE